MVSKVTYKLKLKDIVDADGLNRTEKKVLKEEISEFLVDRILEDVSNQKSPVTGKKWDSLSKKYRDIKKKTARGIANLELTGDMLDALQSKNTKDGIEVGIFKKSEALKADGHCHTGVFGTSKLPERKFIPKAGEGFSKKLIKEMKEIAEDVVAEFKAAKGEEKDLSPSKLLKLAAAIKAEIVDGEGT